MHGWNRSFDRKGSLAGGRTSVVGCLFLLLLFFANPALAATPVINDFNLTYSFTCGERHFLMWADGLELGLTIKLTQAGQPDIVATSIGGIEYDGEALGWVSGVFDLSPGVVGGLWSVVVTNPGGESATLTDALEVVADCPRGAAGDLYVCNTALDNIMQFDGATGEFVCIFGDRPPGTDNNTFTPADLAWAANGHLWVSSTTDSDNPNSVIEYDGNTGAFLRYVVPPTTPSEGLQDVLTLTFGGLDGRLHLASPGGETPGLPDAKVYRCDGEPPAPPIVVLEPEIAPEPIMLNPMTGRFASNGNHLLLGTSIATPKPTFREFDGQTLEFVRDLAIDLGDKKGVVETPDGASYLVTEGRDSRVDRYDIAAGQLVGTVIPEPSSPDPFQAMKWPIDLAFGPNGHVYVSATGTWVQGVPPFGTDFDGGGVHVFDPVTGEQVGLIGHMDLFDGLSFQAEKLLQPHGMEFKPMPGDYTSAGGAFNGDWQVDLNDFEKLTGVSPFTGQPVFTGPGIPCNDPHALLSFDQDRDGDLDLKDYAAFQRAFGTTLGD